MNTTPEQRCLAVLIGAARGLVGIADSPDLNAQTVIQTFDRSLALAKLELEAGETNGESLFAPQLVASSTFTTVKETA